MGSVSIDWEAPDDMGSQILGYRILILESDFETYHQEYTYCDGTTSIIIAQTSCSIPVGTLRGSYFNLPWGSNVIAKVIAYNIYGDSLASQPGDGAVIVTVPDAPLNLAENVLMRGASQIGLTWTEGAHNGGTSVLDYSLWFDSGSGVYVLL
jgi:hypothetical protein